MISAEPTPTFEEPWQYWKARAERLEAKLRRINGLNDHPGHYNSDIQRVLDEAFAELTSHKCGDT